MIKELINSYLIKKYSQIFNLIVFSLSFILSYSYMFIVLPLNSDTTGAYNVGSIANLSYKWSIANGRWSKGLLELFIEKLGYYNIVPMFLFIILFIVCMLFIYNLNNLFVFKNVLVNCFISATFFITPSFTSLFFHINDLYAHIFAIAIGTLIINHCFVKNKWMYYVVLLPLMIGVYQSYVCLICSIYVIYYIYVCLNGYYVEKQEKELISKFLKFIGLTVASILMYFIINAICLRIFNVNSVLSNRFDLDITLNGVLSSFVKMYGMVGILPFKNYAGLNTTTLMKFIFLFSYVLIIISLTSIVKKVSLKRFLYIALLLILLPISMNCITLISSHIIIQMTYGLGLIYLLIAVFFDYILSNIDINFLSNVKNNIINTLLIVIIVHMIYFANGYTYFSKIVSDSTKSFVIELVSKIKNIDNYNDTYMVYFAGNISEENLNDYYSYYDNDVFPLVMPYNSMLFPWEYREAINRYGAYKYDVPNDEEVASIKSTDDFKNMNCYPNYNSIKIIDDIIVVKFSN